MAARGSLEKHERSLQFLAPFGLALGALFRVARASPRAASFLLSAAAPVRRSASRWLARRSARPWQRPAAGWRWSWGPAGRCCWSTVGPAAAASWAFREPLAPRLSRRGARPLGPRRLDGEASSLHMADAVEAVIEHLGIVEASSPTPPARRRPRSRWQAALGSRGSPSSRRPSDLATSPAAWCARSGQPALSSPRPGAASRPLRARWSELRIPAVAPEMTQPLLVIHDAAIARSRGSRARRSRRAGRRGAGHHAGSRASAHPARRAVIGRALEFVARRGRATAAPRRAAARPSPPSRPRDAPS